jgi:hypothetical protein
MQSQRGFWDRDGKEFNRHACNNSCSMSAVDETERFQTHTCEISHGLQLRVSLIVMFLAAGLIAGAKAQQISTSTTDDGSVSVSDSIVTTSQPPRPLKDTTAATRNTAQNPVASVINFSAAGTWFPAKS